MLSSATVMSRRSALPTCTQYRPATISVVKNPDTEQFATTDPKATVEAPKPTGPLERHKAPPAPGRERGQDRRWCRRRWPWLADGCAADGGADLPTFNFQIQFDAARPGMLSAPFWITIGKL